KTRKKKKSNKRRKRRFSDELRRRCSSRIYSHDAISRSQFYSVGPYSSGLKELRTPGAKQQAVRKMDGLLTVPPMESGKRLFYSSIPRKMSSRRKEIDKRDIEMHGSDGEEKEHKRNFKMNFFYVDEETLERNALE
ncbi:hypothetical protein V1478_011329, partial [Vespula squamosa]